MPKITIQVSDESYRILRKIAANDGLTYGRAFEKIIASGRIYDQSELAENIAAKFIEFLGNQDFRENRVGLLNLEGISRTYFLLSILSQKIDPDGHDERMKTSAKNTKSMLSKFHPTKKKE